MTLPQLEKIDTAIVVLSAVEMTINLSLQDLATVIRDPTTSMRAQGVGGQPS
ncbi:unnamed protein product, partial [marine sediment metagenome]